MSHLSLTPKRLRLLNLLSLTMVNTNILVSGGIFFGNTQETNFRNARRVMQELYEAGYINFYKYPVPISETFRRFYYPTKPGLEILGKPNNSFHEIKGGTAEHDSITALFLTHLLRCCEEKNISLLWHPPFEVEGKVCDGAVTLTKKGKMVNGLLLEADTGSHDHREIREKIEAYLPYIKGNPRKKIVFLTQGVDRLRNLQQTVYSVLEEQVDKYQIYLFCPSEFPPTFDLFSKNEKTKRIDKKTISAGGEKYKTGQYPSPDKS